MAGKPSTCTAALLADTLLCRGEQTVTPVSLLVQLVSSKQCVFCLWEVKWKTCLPACLQCVFSASFSPSAHQTSSFKPYHYDFQLERVTVSTCPDPSCPDPSCPDPSCPDPSSPAPSCPAPSCPAPSCPDPSSPALTLSSHPHLFI